MSLVTFVRDYVQDPNRIVHFPNFIFDGCKESFLYIFSFQWFRNLTYVTLSSPSFTETSQNSTLTSTSLFDAVAEGVASHATPYFGQSSLLNNGLLGFINGITSTFSFCAVTIVVFHILLNENKNRAFKIAIVGCFGDVSYIAFILFGFRGLIIPWLTLEPFNYILGLTIQLFFALAIIKDNRKIKVTMSRAIPYNVQNAKGDKSRLSPSVLTAYSQSKASQSGQLSYNAWVAPSLFLFGWCERGGIFQNLASLGVQPSGSYLQTQKLFSAVAQPSLWEHTSTNKEMQLQIFIYLLAFIATRIAFTWIVLSVSQSLIEWKDNTSFSLKAIKNSFRFWFSTAQEMSERIADLGLINVLKQIFIFSINLLRTQGERIEKKLNIRGQAPPHREETTMYPFTSKGPNSQGRIIETHSTGRGEQVPLKNILRDPIAIAAVTCSLAFLPAYSTNLLITKTAGFFPEENRTSHSLLSPWDMPGEILGNDMDHVSNRNNDNNFPEYSFFLPFYDKGDYGGWLGLGEEDVRYEPFYLWRSRRIRAPWRKTNLQEPSSIFTNDKSLFTNPNSTLQQKETTNIKPGLSLLDKKLPPSKVEKINKYVFLRTRLTEPVLMKFNSNSVFSLSNYVPSPAVREEQENVFNKQVTTDTPSYAKTFGGTTKRPDSHAHPWDELNNKNSFRISKEGRKKLVENFKKPERAKTEVIKALKKDASVSLGRKFSLFFARVHKTKPTPSQNMTQGAMIDGGAKSQNNTETFSLTSRSSVQSKGLLGSFPSSKALLRKGPSESSPFTEGVASYVPEGDVSTGGEGNSNFNFTKRDKIARIRAISKRVKEFKFLKKKFQFLKIKDRKKSLKKSSQSVHLKYLKAKKKKRQKLGKYIPKLRRQYPYIRNVKERKLSLFGFYLPTFKEDTSKISNLHQSSQKTQSGLYEEKNKPFYWKGYPKKKDSINYKEDLNLVFRSQMGEDLDFAQEEIQARIFLNPYIRFLLNFRVDNFLSREKFIYNSASYYSGSKVGSDFANPKEKSYGHFASSREAAFSETRGQEKQPRLFPSSKVKSLQESSPITSGDGKSTGKLNQPLTLKGEQDLFRRRLIISKYADTVNFLKPKANHSYTDRIYNHQFKGTLSTARRLFSLKVKYDQPLVHSLDYKPAIENEDLTLRESRLLSSAIAKQTQESKGVADPWKWEPKSSDTQGSNRLNTSNLSSAFEKSCSAPLYVAWEPESRKFIYTNRYLNYGNTFSFFDAKPDGTLVASDKVTRSFPFTKVEKNKDQSYSVKDHQQFTNWPLKEFYFKNNEFFFSQLYSNSRPIDSYLSQENEKARPIALPRRVTSLNTVLNVKSKGQPTDAQNSQKFLKLEKNDKKVFLFKHSWSPTMNDRTQGTKDKAGTIQKMASNGYYLPANVEQQKISGIEERDYPLWMIFRTLPPNLGGFLWPGD